MAGERTVDAGPKPFGAPTSITGTLYGERGKSEALRPATGRTKAQNCAGAVSRSYLSGRVRRLDLVDVGVGHLNEETRLFSKERVNGAGANLRMGKK